MADDSIFVEARASQEKAKSNRRDGGTSTGPSAEYMQARIEVLTKSLIRRYADILDVALDTPAPASDNPSSNTAPPQLGTSVLDTANRQLIVDTSTASLIRAAEELMVLTRTMKELWLFGGLDTLQINETEGEKDGRKKMDDQEGVVVRGLGQWCRREAEHIAGVQERVEVGHIEGDSDVKMESKSDTSTGSASEHD